MANLAKYALAAGAGYALHAYLNRENKVYKPTPLNEDTLAQKIASTVGSHVVEKLFDMPSRYTRTYAAQPRGPQ